MTNYLYLGCKLKSHRTVKGQVFAGILEVDMCIFDIDRLGT